MKNLRERPIRAVGHGGIVPRKIVEREAANASDGLRESESRGRMLLTYRTRIRVVGKSRYTEFRGKANSGLANTAMI